MHTASPLISLCHTHVHLLHEGQQRHVLQDIHFCLHAGEHVAILGANGAGKSTLLRLLRGEVWASSAPAAEPAAEPAAALRSPQEKPITWYVQGVAETSPIMGKRMTALVSAAKQERYVRQEWRLSGEDILLTAFSDSELLYFIPEQHQKEAVYAMAKSLSCLHILSQEACTLSQGQLRLLMLGRALLQKRPVLLLDEYMEGLDAPTRALLLKALQNNSFDAGAPSGAKNAGVSTYIFTGHRQSSVPPWVKHIYMLQNGRLEKISTEKSTQSTTTQKLEASSWKDTISVACACSDSYSVSGPCSSTSATPPFSQESVHMRLENATVFVERKPLLHDISWAWHQGEHWFLHGANGAGKSTFLRLLAGDEYVAFGGLLQRFRLHTAQAPELLQNRVDIGSAVRLVSDKAQMTYAYDCTALKAVLSGIDQVQGQYRSYSEEEHAHAENMLKQFDVLALAHRHIHSLSTGQMRRVLLARALMPCAQGFKPQILLLDEPFSGLDTDAAQQLQHVLQSLCHDVGMLLVSHYSEDCLPCINRHAIMEQGRLRTL